MFLVFLLGLRMKGGRGCSLGVREEDMGMNGYVDMVNIITTVNYF